MRPILSMRKSQRGVDGGELHKAVREFGDTIAVTTDDCMGLDIVAPEISFDCTA
jgi:hypothetical protein